MLEKINRWLKPPVFFDDEDKTRSAQILHALLVDVLILLLLGILGTIFIYANKVLLIAMILFLFAGILILDVLLKRGQVLSASRLFVSGLWIVSSISILLTGRFNTTLVSLQVVVTVLAGVLLGRRSAIIFTLMSVVGGLGLATLEGAGYYFIRYFPLPPLASWFTRTLSFVLIMTSLNPAIQILARSAEELRESEEKFRTLFDWTYDWELWVSPQGRFIYCSRSCERITGWSPDDFLSNADLKKQLVHPDSLEVFQRHYEAEHNATSGPGKIAYRIIARDGSEHWIEHAYYPLFGANDSYLGRRVSNRDITERKRMDIALLDSETKFRAIFESSIDAIGVSKIGVSKMAEHVFVNPAYIALFGYDNGDELVGKPILELIVPDRREQIIQNIRHRALGKPAPTIYETRGLKKNGMPFDLEVHVSTFELHDEMFTLVIERDITERKEYEKALLESEARNRAILNALPDLMFVQSRDGTNLDYHATNQSDLYTSPEQFLGKKMHDVLPEELTVLFLDSIEQALVTGEMQIVDYQLNIAGQVRYFEARIMQQDSDKVVSMIREITERKQVEEQEHKQRILAEALSNSAAALYSTLEFSDVLNLILDNVGLVVPHDAANIMLLETDKDTVTLVSHRGYIERGAKNDEMEQFFPRGHAHPI